MDNQIQYVYFLRRLGVDAGRIIGGDLKEGFKEILTLEFDDCIKTPDGGNLADSEKLKQVKKKYNSISYAGHGDGLFNLYVGVDRHNKVKKIFVEVENEDYGSEYFNTGSQPKLAWIYASYEFNKYYCNDQFFLEKRKDSTIRIKALDMKISSNFILFCDRDHYDPDFAESKEKVDKLFEEEYYSKKNISTSPTGNVANDDSETNIMINQAFPVKNGSYPVYLHCYEKDISEYEGKDRFAKIVVENLEGCYLNKDENGAIIFQRKQTPSLYLEKFFKSKSKKLFADKIDLRDSLSLKEVEKFKNIEELTLCGLSGIKDWSPILKLKKLKKLHLESCLI